MNSFLKIYNHFGKKTQLKKFNEESYELVEAMNENDKEHIIEEIADVIVLINQFCNANNIKRNLLEEMIDYKTRRTLERIESGYYDNEIQE